MHSTKLPDSLKTPYYFRDNFPAERGNRYEVWGCISETAIHLMVVSGDWRVEFITQPIIDGKIPYMIPIGNVFINSTPITKEQYENAVKAELDRINGHTR